MGDGATLVEPGRACTPLVSERNIPHGLDRAGLPTSPVRAILRPPCPTPRSASTSTTSPPMPTWRGPRSTPSRSATSAPWSRCPSSSPRCSTRAARRGPRRSPRSAPTSADIGDLLRLGGQRLPVANAAFRVEHLHVREHRQHPVAHFLLEAVHHRQHDDQRGDAERDPGHRDGGDERDESVAGLAGLVDLATALARAGVAQADLPFVRNIHDRMRWRRAPVARVASDGPSLRRDAQFAIAVRGSNSAKTRIGPDARPRFPRSVRARRRSAGGRPAARTGDAEP